MNIISHGIEIVDVRGIKVLVEQMGRGFEQHCLTATERNTSGYRTNYLQYLASRLAAKKAVLKALNKDCIRPTSWTEIEIQRLPTGEPFIVLFATTLEVAAMLSITKWLLSISHTPFYATASTIALAQCQSQSSRLP